MIDDTPKQKPLLSEDGEESTDLHWDNNLKKKWTLNLFFGNLLLFSCRNSMSVCIPAVSQVLDWDKETSGMVLSTFFVGYVGSNVIGGYIADTYGGAKTILYSSLVWALLTMIVPVFSDVKIILLIWFFNGCFQGFFFPSFTTLITHCIARSEKGAVAGVAYSGCAVGIIMTGFFGSILIEYGQWQLVFILNGLLALIWVYWLRLLCIQNADNNTHKEQITDLRTVTQSIDIWKRLLMDLSVWAFLLAFIGSGITYTVLNSWMPGYFHDMFPQSKGWIFNVVPWFASFVFENVTGYYSNVLLQNGKSVKYLRKLYATILFIGTALFSLILMRVETFPQALLLMSLTAGFTAFSSSSISMNPQDLCPQHAGSLFGVANAMSSVGGSLGVYLTGLVLSNKEGNNWSIIFMANAVVSLTSCLIFLWFGSTEVVV